MSETATKQKRRVEVQADKRHVESWEKAAERNGQDLSNWIRATLIAAAKEQSKK